jgi:hypothetical protein
MQIETRHLPVGTVFFNDDIPRADYPIYVRTVSHLSEAVRSRGVYHVTSYSDAVDLVLRLIAESEMAVVSFEGPGSVVYIARANKLTQMMTALSQPDPVTTN